MEATVAYRGLPIRFDTDIKEHAIASQGPEVAIFLSSLRGGGAERIICNLANAFVDRGVATDLVLVRKEGPYLSNVDPRVRLKSFDRVRPLWSVVPLARYLRHEKPKALLSAIDHTNLVAVAARSLSRAQLRHVVSQRNDPSIRPSLRHEPLEILNYLLLGFGYRRADAVIAVSKGVARSLEETHGVPRDLIHVIYNSVELPEPTSYHDHHPWLSADEPPLVLGAGRLTRQKGFDTLLRAFRLVRENRPARLAILGVGKEEQHLKDLVRALDLEASVLFPGFIPDPWTWMRRAEVFALSSRWEGLPGVLLQAMACGTPVVSTDCPSGPYEILDGGRWGRLVPVDDYEAMAQAILSAFDDMDPPPVAKRAAEFDLSSTVDKYLKVLGVDYEDNHELSISE